MQIITLIQISFLVWKLFNFNFLRTPPKKKKKKKLNFLHVSLSSKYSNIFYCILTIHRTRSCVADMARTVTFFGACAGGAWIVWKSFVGSLGRDKPTTLQAISRKEYCIKGTKPVTVNVEASGSDISKIVLHVVLRAVWASIIHFVIELNLK